MGRDLLIARDLVMSCRHNSIEYSLFSDRFYIIGRGDNLPDKQTRWYDPRKGDYETIPLLNRYNPGHERDDKLDGIVKRTSVHHVLLHVNEIGEVFIKPITHEKTFFVPPYKREGIRFPGIEKFPRDFAEYLQLLQEFEITPREKLLVQEGALIVIGNGYTFEIRKRDSRAEDRAISRLRTCDTGELDELN